MNGGLVSKHTAGVDEAGRGPLAGPVIAAACILLEGFNVSGITDSKQLTAGQRAELYGEITSHPSCVYSSALVDVETIDAINILQATLLAMKLAIEGLPTTPSLLLIDGPHTPKIAIPSVGIIKGDLLHQEISAASIIAKYERDLLMNHYHEQWPEYGFNSHKGYGTAKHREAISRFGPCPIHRRSFSPIKELVEA